MRPMTFYLLCLIVLPCWIGTPVALSAQQQPAILTLTRPPPIRLSLCFEPRGSLALSGAGLPASQGDWGVLVRAGDVTIELPVESWTATKIVVRLPSDALLAPGVSYPLGIRDASGTWLADADRPLILCDSAAPILATPGIQEPAARLDELLPPPLAALTGVGPLAKQPTGEGVAVPVDEETGRAVPQPEKQPPGAAVAESVEKPSGIPVAEEHSAEPGITRTPAISLTGYGTAPSRPMFVGRTMPTPAISLTGYGTGPPPRGKFEPITLTTPAIRLTGAP